MSEKIPLVDFPGTVRLAHNRSMRPPKKSAAELLGPAYPPGMTTARQIVIDFLQARVDVNNARMMFIMDNTPENLRAWVDADAKLADLHESDYYPAEPK